jgi:hypothetical protein
LWTWSINMLILRLICIIDSQPSFSQRFRSKTFESFCISTSESKFVEGSNCKPLFWQYRVYNVLYRCSMLDTTVASGLEMLLIKLMLSSKILLLDIVLFSTHYSINMMNTNNLFVLGYWYSIVMDSNVQPLVWKIKIQKLWKFLFINIRIWICRGIEL